MALQPTTMSKSSATRPLELTRRSSEQSASLPKSSLSYQESLSSSRGFLRQSEEKEDSGDMEMDWQSSQTSSSILLAPTTTDPSALKRSKSAMQEFIRYGHLSLGLCLRILFSGLSGAEEAGTPKDKLWHLYMQPLGQDTPTGKRTTQSSESQCDRRSWALSEPIPKLLLDEIDEVNANFSFVFYAYYIRMLQFLPMN